MPEREDFGLQKIQDKENITASKEGGENIQLTVLLAVDVTSAWNGESTQRSETSNLPENAPAGEITNSVIRAKKAPRCVDVDAIVNS